ncbi:MAG: Smr/MutS family protein [Acidobacteria bacterium]|nr:Smr/MutS family protein [Acidobacteriota bacterium]
MNDPSDNPEEVDPCGEPVEIPIEDCLDLHSFQPREVPSVVEEYLHQALQKGFPLVRIIHGRGIGVQREIVQSILRKHPGVVSFAGTADRGATIVTLGPRQKAGANNGQRPRQRRS